MFSRHIVLIAALALAACGDGHAATQSSSTSEEAIVLDREVVIDDIGGNISSITRTRAGFVVTGSFGRAWAVATDQKAKYYGDTKNLGTRSMRRRINLHSTGQSS
jgi:hypothetical protein